MQNIDRETRLVFEHAGLALYHAQVFEEGLGWFIQAWALAQEDISTEEQRIILEEALRAKTLGGLMKATRARLSFGPEVDAALNQALADRNYLAHHFFKDDSLAWVLGHKRDEMLAKLDQYRRHFRMAGRAIQAHARATYRQLGYSEEKAVAILLEEILRKAQPDI